MRTYQINAISRKGQEIHEMVSADDIAALQQIIKKRELYLIDYREIKSAAIFGKKLKTKDLIIYCRQLGTMVKAGIPILKAIDIQMRKTQKKDVRQIYSNINESVQKGNSLSTAMLDQAGAFPNLLVNMIAAGEVGGTLDQSLMIMADFYEKDHKSRSKIRNASIYPIVLMTVTVIVIIILVSFVLPNIIEMFDPEDIPFTTKIVLGFGKLLTGHWVELLLILATLIVGFRVALSDRRYRVKWDEFKLRMPILGKLNQTLYSARCARSFSSMYQSGIQTLAIIESTGKVLGNTYLEDRFDEVANAVQKGELISTAIENTESFDEMLSSMIYIGEESGSLGTILKNAAEYFDTESDNAIQRMIALLEPAMILVLGVIIGFAVISVLQPIYQMYNSIGN